MLVATAPASASPLTIISGAALVRDLRAGRAVIHEGVRVKGPVELSAADSIRAVFRCRVCTFDSAVSAPDASFERVVDLSGSTFTRSVNFRGTTFHGPTLFRKAFDEGDGRVADRGTSFAGRVDFSLATFSDFASFSGATFAALADFRDARFQDASFAPSTFEEEAAFERTTFTGAAIFDHGRFYKIARFADAEFRNRANFSQALFLGGEVFSRAQFGNSASFLNATLSTPSGASARFDDVVAARDLDFTFVDFSTIGDSTKDVAPIADFSYLVSGGSLLFRDTTFEPGRTIVVQRLQARDLVLDVGAVSQIKREDDQTAVLEMIEESGKVRGDLAAANDAHYALRAERSKDYSTVGRGLDYVFYRGIAGYLVRPMRPLVILVCLVAALSLASVVRARRRRQSDARTAGGRLRGRRIWAATTGRCGEFLTCFLDKLNLVKPQRDTGESAAVGRRLESFAYRLLVVCAILGLANSNPTLRQMVETLF